MLSTDVVREPILTSFRLELELSLHGVVAAVQQTAVDGECAQF